MLLILQYLIRCLYCRMMIRIFWHVGYNNPGIVEWTTRQDYLHFTIGTYKLTRPHQ